ncbi:MAG: DUF4199 domain-containing protein [Bacteroidales bacterium]|nr:DUF4199 domain-containing protein [Bacteroidales bacterium]
MEKISGKIISSEAAGAALVFGAISGGFIFINNLLAGLELQILGSVLGIILWLAKFVGCILLMRFFMKKLMASYEEVGRNQLLGFGTLIALFSAIITAACSYIAVEYVFPEMTKTAFDTMYQSMGAMLDSNSMAVMEKMESHYGMISLWGNLIWCFIYGWILSAIMAGSLVRKKNIFDDDDI